MGGRNKTIKREAMIINLISLPKRHDRRVDVTRQMEMEKCSFTFWDGVEGKIPKANIHKAFKQIIKLAKDKNDVMCCIGEDDLQWCGTGAWKYFLDNIPKDFDVYTASYYSGSHDENFVVTGFRGMTLIIVHSRFYDKFLSLPEHIHIDSALAMSGAKIIVSPLFVATQRPGWSDQRKRYADDSKRIAKKELYGQ